MAAPKKYPDELKARAVRLYRDADPQPTIRKLAAQLGVHHCWFLPNLRVVGLWQEHPDGAVSR
ncbi:transposase [Nocardia wallacei]|uniref:transposase n=1 Tax=Nocardia wallacei TaxID=480035 RepID=UPI0024579714|nr:transposase [Nocardia wallacei]